MAAGLRRPCDGYAGIDSSVAYDFHFCPVLFSETLNRLRLLSELGQNVRSLSWMRNKNLEYRAVVGHLGVDKEIKRCQPTPSLNTVTHRAVSWRC